MPRLTGMIVIDSRVADQVELAEKALRELDLEIGENYPSVFISQSLEISD